MFEYKYRRVDICVYMCGKCPWILCGDWLCMSIGVLGKLLECRYMCPGGPTQGGGSVYARDRV